MATKKKVTEEIKEEVKAVEKKAKAAPAKWSLS